MRHEWLRRAREPEILPVRTGVVMRLSSHLWRLTCANGGPLTGPGTNSYFVGEAGHWALIDPGPDDPRHLHALQRAAPGPIREILVTHTHPDHSPGAATLKRLTGTPLFGRTCRHRSGQDLTFSPDRELADGETIGLGGRVRLRVYHTPGHASNHLCYLLEPDQVLLTGDHIIQGSTVVIDPPDGDMREYLASLERLLTEELTWLAPGHGTLIAHPHEALCALIAHRLSRESQIFAALSAEEPAALATLVARVYADVPQSLHALAERSVLAHLLKLQTDGRAQRRADAWLAVTAV